MCVRVLKLPLADSPSSSRTHTPGEMVPCLSLGIGHTLTLALWNTDETLTTHIYLLLFFSHIFFASCFSAFVYIIFHFTF